MIGIPISLEERIYRAHKHFEQRSKIAKAYILVLKSDDIYYELFTNCKPSEIQILEDAVLYHGLRVEVDKNIIEDFEIRGVI